MGAAEVAATLAHSRSFVATRLLLGGDSLETRSRGALHRDGSAATVGAKALLA